MLRITRRAGERIIVGGEVLIEVLEVRGATVRLGIDAPRSVSIYREELWLEIKQENEAAASATGELPPLPGLFPEPDAGGGPPAPESPDTDPSGSGGSGSGPSGGGPSGSNPSGSGPK
jgi:carbon storage regulator